MSTLVWRFPKFSDLEPERYDLLDRRIRIEPKFKFIFADNKVSAKNDHVDQQRFDFQLSSPSVQSISFDSSELHVRCAIVQLKDKAQSWRAQIIDESKIPGPP